MKILPQPVKGILALGLAAVIWLPCLHFFFAPRLEDYRSEKGIPPATRALAARHLQLWENPALRAQEIQRMRISNAEWDFMGRTYLVLSLANMSLREPSEKAHYLGVMDRIIDETLRLEKENGLFFFLMEYARDANFVVKPARSIFQDGEITLMLGARQLVEEKASYRLPLKQRVDAMVHSMNQSPVLCGESYPDECWTFCNTVALASIRIYDALSGENHDELIRRWLETARQKLVEPKTGILVSSFTVNGQNIMDGPEGSSIWMAAHCLQILDPAFAKDQYDRARKELRRNVLGFGYAREWPASYTGPADVDSGPIIPVLEGSAGSSGLALVAASAFGDAEFLKSLVASLNLAGFPSREDGALKYCASNQVGDAVLLYAMTLGPLWKRVMERHQGNRMNHRDHRDTENKRNEDSQIPALACKSRYLTASPFCNSVSP